MAYYDQGRQANEKVGVLIGKMYLTLASSKDIIIYVVLATHTRLVLVVCLLCIYYSILESMLGRVRKHSLINQEYAYEFLRLGTALSDSFDNEH